MALAVEIRDGNGIERSDVTPAIARFEDEREEGEPAPQPGSFKLTPLKKKCWLCKKAEQFPDVALYCECLPAVGLVHRACLIDWMNKLCKGRCPKCCYMFRIQTNQVPWKQWQADPLMVSHKKRHVLIVASNLIITLIFIASFTYLLIFHFMNITIVLGLLYFFYLCYYVRVYHRIYERLKMFNNCVTRVYRINENPDAKQLEARGNLSGLQKSASFDHVGAAEPTQSTQMW